MVIFACRCLNVKLHVKEFKTVEDDDDDDSAATNSDLFMGKQIIEAVLDDASVTMTHTYLVHCRQFGDWTTFLCLNCNQQTHAVKSGCDSILINSELESDPSVIERLMRSSSFSAVFRIVLQNPGPDLTSSLPDPRSHAYESLQSHFTRVQQQLNVYLLQEESAMEDRIRQYEQEQKAAFQELQNSAKSDKRKMISALIMASQARMGSSVDEKAVDTEQETRARKRDLKASRSGPLDSKKSSDHHNLVRTFSNFEQSPDTEAMFYLDEVDPQFDRPFYDSDEEDTKTADETPSSSHRELMYSSSVPISVPTWKSRNGSTDEDNEQENTPSNPEQIAANMQALAESITDNGRYIFGDRPRPRLNTGDFSTLKR